MTESDLLAALEPDHVEPLASRLLSAYYIPLDRLRSAVAERSSCNFIHLATMFKIDIFVSKGRAFDRQAAERARPEAIDDNPDAPRFPVASPEDTVLSKLEWFRLVGETSERQWWDIVGVLRVTHHADREHLRLLSPHVLPLPQSLPLQTGARLGPYEIQSALGAGGMGEVYKANDTRLDRKTGTRR